MRTIRAAIRAGHVDTGADDPTGHAGVRRVLQGLTRQAAGRGRGQADPLTADDVAAIMATASIPRRTGRGMESEADAADRGATDRAIVAVLFQGGLRRSEAAALRWADVQDAADGRGIVVYVRRSKTDQDGTAADVRYLKNGCAAARAAERQRRPFFVVGWSMNLNELVAAKPAPQPPTRPAPPQPIPRPAPQLTPKHVGGTR